MRCWGDEESELPGEKIQSYGHSGRDGDRVSDVGWIPLPSPIQGSGLLESTMVWWAGRKKHEILSDCSGAF